MCLSCILQEHYLPLFVYVPDFADGSSVTPCSATSITGGVKWNENRESPRCKKPADDLGALNRPMPSSTGMVARTGISAGEGERARVPRGGREPRRRPLTSPARAVRQNTHSMAKPRALGGERERRFQGGIMLKNLHPLLNADVLHAPARHGAWRRPGAVRHQVSGPCHGGARSSSPPRRGPAGC